MANDREVLRDIWDGKLPVCFNINDEEICDLQTPESYYLMIPRLSYFPLVWDKVRINILLFYIHFVIQILIFHSRIFCIQKVKKHFVKHIHSDRQEMEMWLDYNGTPLKWF